MRTDFYVVESGRGSTIKPLSRRAYSWLTKNMPQARWHETTVILADARMLDLVLLSISNASMSFVAASE